MWSTLGVVSTFVVVVLAAPPIIPPLTSDNQIGLDKASSTEPNIKVKLCRPDHLLVDGERCVPLKMSLSDLIREILENSESTMSLAHYNIDEKSHGSEPPARVPVSDLFIQNLAVLSEANMSSCMALATCNEQCFAWPVRSKEQRQHEIEVIERFILSPSLKAELIKTATVPADNTAKGKDDDAGGAAEESEDGSTGSAPDFVMTIMTAAKRGIDISKSAAGAKNLTAICSDSCRREFNGNTVAEGTCSPMQYDYTVRINAIYRSLVEANVTLYDKSPTTADAQSDGSGAARSPEALYYTYSMRFLDLANLTSCFAQVGCENTCEVYKLASASNSTAEGANEAGEETPIEAASTPLPPPPVPSSPFIPEGQDRPAAVNAIHEGTLAGYNLALEGACSRCAAKYKGSCTSERYLIARSSLAIFG